MAEDGREYYKQNIAFFGRALYDPKDTSQWIVENVFPHLSRNPLDWCDLSVMKAEILVFMDIGKYGKPELWGYYSGFDYVVLSQLFGTMEDWPKGWPMYIRDIQQVVDERNIGDLPPQPVNQHHALADAKWIKEAWERVYS